MSEELENSVRETLKSTTWTRAGIRDFTKSNLVELSQLLEKVFEENCSKQIKDICDEQLSKTNDSIVALYLSGMIDLRERSLDNSKLVSLVDILEKNHKEALIEYLCNSILEEDPQNKFAIRKLAEFYKEANNDKVWELYEQIVKIDLEEAEIAKTLAERYEGQNNQELAISYYKKALLRFVGNHNISSIKEIWTKLVSLIPEEIDFFLLIQRKIAKSISETKSAALMQELYQYYKDTAKWDTAISILKLILAIDNKDSWARKEIIECFRGKYSDHSHLEDYIRTSNLDTSFRNVFEAISDFEKHISFDAKNYVFHRTWGVGIITKVQGDQLTINFGKKSGIHPMSLKMAVSALQPLAKDHIWVLKATKKKEELAKMVKGDVEGTLTTIIKSFDNKCDDKKIKAELVPSILTPGEWTSWHAKAQKVFAENKIFGVSPEDISIHTVRDHEISAEERYSNEFKAEKDFFKRIEIITRYVDDDETDKTDELFADMYNYFAGYLKSFQNLDEQVVASYLTVQGITKKLPSFTFPATFTFEQLYGDIDNKRDLFNKLKDSKGTSLRTDFIANVRQLPDWDEQYIHLFPTVLDKGMLNMLISNGKQDKVQKLVQDCFEDYRNNRDAAVFLFKECRNEDWFKAAAISEEKQLITLINIISLCYREVDNHVNTTENKKTIKNARNLLFAEKTSDGTKNNLLDFMLSGGADTITRLYTMVSDVKNLESADKTQLRNGILSKFPDYKFQEAEIKHETQKGLLVTAKMLEIKRDEAEHIEKVLLPQITQEVSDARAKGDLKENAEYSSAKEAQHIANVKLSNLKDELARAVIFDPTTVTTSMVSFGTKVTLQNNKENKEEVLTIFGPWESDPEKGFISYLSPLGNNLLEARTGDNLKFNINGKDFDYTVKSIAQAQF
ncbi:MAG TPA: transcription elongation factor GreA [Treponema sp.]|nr:transcription elongation factor GreA [Treponema sp.]